MRHLHKLILVAAFSQSPIGLAVAQTDRTDTAGVPPSTEKAPSITATGQTKPPSRDAGPASGDERDIQLEELRMTAPPKRQGDLDTVALASAHRERARSVEEKTNGLWQSWVVSICDGCGDQKPVKARKPEDQPARDAPMTTGSVGQKHTQDKAQPDAMKRAEIRRHGSVAADLSTQNIDTIRRMPHD